MTSKQPYPTDNAASKPPAGIQQHAAREHDQLAPEKCVPSGVTPNRLTIAAYASLAFPLAAAFIALQVVIPTFYAENSSLSLSLIGGLLLIARLADTVTDPLVGYGSDRSRNRFGRRKIFVVIATPLIAISVWFLFLPPPDPSAAYLLLWTVAIYVAGTLSIVPGSAWAAELSEDYNQRSVIAGARVAFGLCGTLMALLLIALVSSEQSQNLDQALLAITTLVIVTLVLATVWAVFRVPDTAVTQLPERSMQAAWQLMQSANPFRQLLVSFLFNAVANAIPATLFLLYVTHVLQVPGLAGPMLFLYFIAAALAVPVWLAISRRLGKHRTWSVAMIMACLFFCWTPFLDADQVHWFWVIVLATGFTTGADLSLPSAINADVIEWDALENGYRRPGLFFALWGTASKLSYALAIGIAFPLLDLAGFSAQQNNDSDVLLWLAILYGGPCILFKLLAIYTLRNYPISEAEHRRIRTALAAREAEH